MANHPNRGKKSVVRNPKSEEIKKARLTAGLTQTEAAALIYCTLRAWQQWEAEEGSPAHNRMHPAFWELFKIKVAELGISATK